MSLLFLIAANLLPVAGVLFLGWSALEVVALYWIENLIVGLFNIAKIIAAQPEGAFSRSDRISKFFVVPFFSAHYFGFCLVHGTFLVVVLAGQTEAGTPDFRHAIEELTHPFVGVVILSLLISHGVSFVTDYLRQGRHKLYPSMLIMFFPYPRVVVLHLALLLGMALALWLGEPLAIVLILVALKTSLDVLIHRTTTVPKPS